MVFWSHFLCGELIVRPAAAQNGRWKGRDAQIRRQDKASVGVVISMEDIFGFRRAVEDVVDPAD